MTYGIELLNLQSRLVIGSAAKNLVFIQKLTGVIPQYDNDIITGGFQEILNRGLILTTSLTDQSKPPVIYFVPENSSSSAYGITRIFYSEGRWRIQLWGDYDKTHAVEVYVFSDPSGSPYDPYGLRTFSADGSVAFDSGARSLISAGDCTVSRASDSISSSSFSKIWSLGEGSAALPYSGKVALLAPPFFCGCYQSATLGMNSHRAIYYIGSISRQGNSLFTRLSYVGQIGIGVRLFLSGVYWSSLSISVINASLYD